jgi:starch-binding outer membrane protein, SusD/RagB family
MKNVLFRGLITLSVGTALASVSTSCTKDLDQTPKYELTPDKVYVDLASYKKVLGKIYGGFALTSLDGAGGTSDLTSIDGGTGDYLRQLWSAQELTTDEAVVAWPDPGIKDWHNMNWDANNPLIRGIYNRAYYEIGICNEFIRESSDDKLSSRLSSSDAELAKSFRAEARFLRAVSYMHVVDLFGGGPYVTDADVVGAAAPPYRTRQELYNFVEDELKALTAALPEYRTEYGRVDRNAAKGMLARLYLNAEVYTGKAMYADAARLAKEVIDAKKYTLTNGTKGTAASSAYGLHFLADNNTNEASSELIWPVLFDVTRTQTYGGTTFLVNGSTSGSNGSWQKYVGETTGWEGLRTTSALFNKFFLAGGDTTVDRRGRFWQVGQTKEIADLNQFSQGLGVTKYRNVTSAGVGVGGTLNFSGVDFPMLRVSDMMLIYAEAATRSAADRATALTYVNQIRRRAFGKDINTANAQADITDAQMTSGFILDERARELHWEGLRRSDLIRYNQFVENTYLWPWKGGVASGRSVDAKYKLFPIPLSDLTANPNLKQNTGY